MERRDFLAGAALTTGAVARIGELGAAAAAESGAARRPFQPDDARRLRFVRDAGFLAGGPNGYYTVAAIDDSLQERHSLWLFFADGSPSRQLAATLPDLSSPAPSPDGRTIAIVAEVRGKRQIRLAPVSGGPIRTLTNLPQGVGGRPAWSPDGRFLAFSAGPPKARDRTKAYRLERVTYRSDGMGYLDDVVQNLYLVEVATGAVRQLTNDRSMHTDPQWSPDGRTIAHTVSFQPDHEWNFLPELHLVDVASGAARTLVGSWGGVFGFRWFPDGTRIAFKGSRGGTGFFASRKTDLWTIPIAGGDPVCRTTNLVPGVGITVQADLPIYGELTDSTVVIDGDNAYLSGPVGGDVAIYRVGLTGPERVERILTREGSTYFIDFSPAGGTLYQATSFNQPPELYRNETAVTSLNRAVIAEIQLPDVKAFRVTAPDGVEIDAWAMTPPGSKGPWPTVLQIHGGPYGAFGSTYTIDFQLLVGAGFAVVFHNFRGSGGYGTEFSQRIVGHWGTAGSLDHHAVVDAAIAMGIADPNKLGVAGLSHGGFATCWLVGNSDRFKAALAENPVTNFASAWGEMDAGWWVAEELGGKPWEISEVYRQRSPLTYAHLCKTPILFVIGEADLRCHPVEAEQYHRVVKGNGVPTEIVRLPNSSHVGSAVGPVPARLAQNDALVEWFTRYLR